MLQLDIKVAARGVQDLIVSVNARDMMKMKRKQIAK